jgi:hypothetical protein
VQPLQPLGLLVEVMVVNQVFLQQHRQQLPPNTILLEQAVGLAKNVRIMVGQGAGNHTEEMFKTCAVVFLPLIQKEFLLPTKI